MLTVDCWRPPNPCTCVMKTVAITTDLRTVEAKLTILRANINSGSPSWNFVYFISFILRLEWQDEVGMTKSIIPGSFRTEWWSNETNNLIPHLCHPRPFWHGMIFEWQISSFRSHSGMTWDECLFAQNISRLLGRAMEGKRNDAEWLRNDRMTQEWWKDKRTTQMTKGW